jgi:hypothetical protein
MSTRPAFSQYSSEVRVSSGGNDLAPPLALALAVDWFASHLCPVEHAS